MCDIPVCLGADPGIKKEAKAQYTRDDSYLTDSIFDRLPISIWVIGMYLFDKNWCINQLICPKLPSWGFGFRAPATIRVWLLCTPTCVASLNICGLDIPYKEGGARPDIHM